MQERQRSRLAGERVEWLTAAPRDFAGVMLANEVLDVMPVRLFVKREGAALERGVAMRDGAFCYAERAAPADLLAAVDEIEHEVGPLPDGYASELGLAARAWVRSVADWLDRGLVLLIDYGFPRREYYHPQRLMGTIMCHYRHHSHADALWLPGLNDVTAHVDFTAMADAAAASRPADHGLHDPGSLSSELRSSRAADGHTVAGRIERRAAADLGSRDG